MLSNQTEYADKCNKSNKLNKVRSIINQYFARKYLSSDKLSLKEKLEHMSFADIVDYAVNYHREIAKQLKELSIVKHKYSKILKTINKLEGGRKWLH